MWEVIKVVGGLVDVVLYIEYLSIEVIDVLMYYMDVVMILVIGGLSMVIVVYLLGKLVLGVGFGNGLIYVEKIVDIK